MTVKTEILVFFKTIIRLSLFSDPQGSYIKHKFMRQAVI